MSKVKQLPAVFLLSLSLFLPGAIQAAELESQTNGVGPVTVKVTPRNISPGTRNWDFEITLTTHSSSLDTDMTRAAVLIAGSDKPQPPLSWEGDPPGGHHRKGVLRFPAPTVMPHFLELHISGIGEVKQRVFRWRLTK